MRLLGCKSSLSTITRLESPAIPYHFFSARLVARKALVAEPWADLGFHVEDGPCIPFLDLSAWHRYLSLQKNGDIVLISQVVASIQLTVTSNVPRKGPGSPETSVNTDILNSRD